MTSNHILLTGAGFSKNWGGWLAAELWAVILSHPKIQINENLKEIIWKYRDGGFEEIFEDERVRTLYLKDYTEAVTESLLEMHRALKTSRQTLRGNEQRSNRPSRIFFSQIIPKFHSIFTLNQDLFFESLHPGFDEYSIATNPQSSRYFYPHVSGCGYEKYKSIHGFEWLNNLTLNETQKINATLVVNAKPYELRIDSGHCPLPHQIQSHQDKKPTPYYKLHGSLNFYVKASQLLIMGTKKLTQIEDDGKTLLKKYLEDFKSTLMQKSSKLMIIGYSFSDEHINKIIFEAAEKGDLKLWIIDPSGLESIIKKINEKNSSSKNFENLLKKSLISISSSNLKEIFNVSDLEMDMLNKRFFC